MSKLIIERTNGKELTTAKNVIKALGNDYKVTELISDDDFRFEEKKVIAGTCSACPFFTDLVDRPEQWGRCAKYGDAAINREHKFCKAHLEELNYKEKRC